MQWKVVSYLLRLPGGVNSRSIGNRIWEGEGVVWPNSFVWVCFLAAAPDCSFLLMQTLVPDPGLSQSTNLAVDDTWGVTQ